MKYVFLALTALPLLGGCIAPVHTVVREPETGRIETCTTTFSFWEMALSGQFAVASTCSDGTSFAARFDPKNVRPPIPRDRDGVPRTCDEFSSALCWPTIKVLPR